MDSSSKTDHCRFLIGRFDHFTDGVNSKVAFYLSINTFILGGICVGYSTFYKNCSHTLGFYVLIILCILLLLCCMGSIFFTIRAVAPYLKDNNLNDDKASLIYFGGIAKFNCNEFQEKFDRQDESSLLTDFVRQTHSLAKGLDMKFRNLWIANRFLMGEYILLVVVIILSFLILN